MKINQCWRAIIFQSQDTYCIVETFQGSKKLARTGFNRSITVPKNISLIISREEKCEEVSMHYCEDGDEPEGESLESLPIRIAGTASSSRARATAVQISKGGIWNVQQFRQTFFSKHSETRRTKIRKSGLVPEPRSRWTRSRAARRSSSSTPAPRLFLTILPK